MGRRGVEGRRPRAYEARAVESCENGCGLAWLVEDNGSSPPRCRSMRGVFFKARLGKVNGEPLGVKWGGTGNGNEESQSLEHVDFVSRPNHGGPLGPVGRHPLLEATLLGSGLCIRRQTWWCEVPEIRLPQVHSHLCTPVGFRSPDSRKSQRHRSRRVAKRQLAFLHASSFITKIPPGSRTTEGLNLHVYPRCSAVSSQFRAVRLIYAAATPTPMR